MHGRRWLRTIPFVFSRAGEMAYEISTYRYGFISPQGPVVDEGKYLIT